MAECRPLGLLIGLPFALIALVLALIGAVVWLIGSVFTCICPCCFCFPMIVDLAVELIKMPIKVIRWFIEKIPC